MKSPIPKVHEGSNTYEACHCKLPRNLNPSWSNLDLSHPPRQSKVAEQTDHIASHPKNPPDLSETSSKGQPRRLRFHLRFDLTNDKDARFHGFASCPTEYGSHLRSPSTADRCSSRSSMRNRAWEPESLEEEQVVAQAHVSNFYQARKDEMRSAS